MLKSRTHTFYLKNMDKKDPLIKLNENPYETNKYIFENWKKENNKYSDKYLTNVHIVFD